MSISSQNWPTDILPVLGARVSVVGSGTMLQTGRSRVRFPMRSLDFSNELILPAALWLWSRPVIFLTSKGGRRARLTTLSSYVSWFSRKCGSLDVSQPYGFSRTVTGIVLALPALCFIWDNWRFFPPLNTSLCILTAASLWMHSSILRIEMKIRQLCPSCHLLWHIQARHGVIKLRRNSAACTRAMLLLVGQFRVFSIDCAKEGTSPSASDVGNCFITRKLLDQVPNILPI
jgi:hypothetical protein